MDGETYECVKSFCYLGDTLDGDGGADLAATARIRNGWMKIRELLPFLTSRAPPLEMIRWMCGISLKDRTNEELKRLVGVEPIRFRIHS